MDQRSRNIVVIGAGGMLGQMVQSYFTFRGHEVVAVKERFDEGNVRSFMTALNREKDSVLINCIGKIKQKSTALNELLWANSILPLELTNSLDRNITLVHPSTDCVFSGDSGPFDIDSTPDARDDYGWSKQLGDTALRSRNNTLIVRVSIIGPDRSAQPRGLLGWFLSNKGGSQLNGFKNHLWNGITTLEWCKQVEILLAGHAGPGEPCRLVQLGTAEHYSKYDMLLLFQQTFGTDFSITEFEAEEAVDRRLVPEIVSRPLEEQLAELKDHMP